MSSTAYITIDGYPIETFRNGFDPWLFKKADRQIVTSKRSERNRLIWGTLDSDDKDESEQWYVYQTTAASLKRRLELAGCTRATLDLEFQAAIERWIDALQGYENGRDRHIRVLKTSSLELWLEKLQIVINQGLRFNRWHRTDYEDDVLNIMLNYDPRYEFDGVWSSSQLNFPCATLEGFGLAFVELVSDDALCVLDVTDLISGGWTNAFDDLMEYSRPVTAAYDTFEVAIREIRDLTILSPDNPSLIRLLYANVITSMEAYLGDTLKKNVLTREPLLRKFVESHRSFTQSKISMADIFREHSRIRATVNELLADTIFHDIGKIRSLYGSVFSVTFPESTVEILHRAVAIRHHIVHRNGLDHTGQQVTLTLADVDGLIQAVEVTIQAIDKQIKDGLIDEDDLS